MNIIVCENKKDVSSEAFDIFADVVGYKADPVVGLATGDTPLGLYQAIIDAFKNDDIDLADLVTFNLDEYLGLEPNHPQSFYKFMFDNFFSATNIKRSNINIPPGLGDPEENCKAYEKKIEAAGGLDLQVLGIGRNGHIGFNEPGTDFGLGTHTTDLTEDTILANSRFFSTPDEVPRKAITMGIKSIMNARKIILLAYGKGKADAIYKTVCGPVTTDCPSSVLQLHPDVTLILDREAAGKLE